MTVFIITFAEILIFNFIMGKVLYKVTLTEEERADLLCITKKGKHSARKVVHALILLNADEGSFAELPKKTNKSIAETP